MVYSGIHTRFAKALATLLVVAYAVSVSLCTCCSLPAGKSGAVQAAPTGPSQHSCCNADGTPSPAGKSSTPAECPGHCPKAQAAPQLAVLGNSEKAVNDGPGKDAAAGVCSPFLVLLAQRLPETQFTPIERCPTATPDLGAICHVFLI